MRQQQSPTLLLDLGNSRIKWAWLDRSGLSGLSSAEHSEAGLAGLLSALTQRTGSQPQAPTKVWLASVVDERASAISSHLANLGCQVRRAHSRTRLGALRNGYVDPSQLGVDRFLALLGACSARPGLACLVVDAGTAVTIDQLAADGSHQGGWILPGLALMRRSLATGTERLGAALQASDPASAHTLATIGMGRDTRSAIESGILAATVGAIEWQRARLGAERPVPLLLCGGDAAQLAVHLRQPLQLIPELVLLGLAQYAQLVIP